MCVLGRGLSFTPYDQSGTYRYLPNVQSFVFSPVLARSYVLLYVRMYVCLYVRKDLPGLRDV